MKKKKKLSIFKRIKCSKEHKTRLRLSKRVKKSNDEDILNILNNTEKVKRLDRKRAGKEKSVFNHQVIKYRLNTILKDSDNIKRLNDIVNTVNQMSNLAYDLINLYVLTLLENQEPIPALDQTFFNRVCNSISSQNGIMKVPKAFDQDQTFKDCLEKFKASIPKDYSYPDRKGLGLIQNFLTADMRVSTTNHLTLNFESRFKKLLKLVDGVVSPYQKTYIFQSLFNLRGNYPSKLDSDLRTQLIIRKYLNKLGRFEDDSILKDPNFTLPFYFQTLRTFERLESKTFSLMPSKSTLIPGHITISSSCLVDILSLWTQKARVIFNVLSEKECWNEIFRIPKNNQKWFAGMITTNGYDVSVYYFTPPKGFKYSSSEWGGMDDSNKIKILDEMIQEKKESKKNKKESKVIPVLEESQEVVGVDPGHRALFTMTDTKGNLLSCSSSEFKHLTGQKKRLSTINRRKDSIPVLSELNQWSLKTSSIETFLTNLKARMSVFSEVIKEYKKYFYRKLNFTGRIKKQKTFHELGRRIVERYGRALVGWGNGGTNQKGLKGSHMPNKEFFEYLRKNTYLTMTSTDEYRTSLMCSRCGSETCSIKYWKEFGSDGKEDQRLIGCYGLRRCKNNECRITWDRDVNACQNILMVLSNDLNGLERPLHLQRPIKKQTEKPR